MPRLCASCSEYKSRILVTVKAYQAVFKIGYNTLQRHVTLVLLGLNFEQVHLKKMTNRSFIYELVDGSNVIFVLLKFAWTIQTFECRL